MNHAVLPLINGITPSSLYLPKNPDFTHKTIFEYLLVKFPHIAGDIWRQRFDMGKVTDAVGTPLFVHTPYQHGITILYYRELPPQHEPIVPFRETILYIDEHLIVVDKPHFLPVIPTGKYVSQTLLTRLRLRPELAHLATEHITPIHRLDKDTAGVMLFSHNPTTRSQYQRLFQDKKIHKIYHAIAPTLPQAFPIEIRSRLVRGDTFFTTQTVAGAINAITHIAKLHDFVKDGQSFSLYELTPITGKKHQLRVHMNSLGMPIVNDRLYPKVLAQGDTDFSHPLQLLAKKIVFIDPLTAEKRVFTSERSLDFA